MLSFHATVSIVLLCILFVMIHVLKFCRRNLEIINENRIEKDRSLQYEQKLKLFKGQK
jgi:hypothetical protein